MCAISSQLFFHSKGIFSKVVALKLPLGPELPNFVKKVWVISDWLIIIQGIRKKNGRNSNPKAEYFILEKSEKLQIKLFKLGKKNVP